MGCSYIKIKNIYISRGNHKINKNIGIYNLPTVLTCPNSERCKNKCYAKQAELRYSMVLPSRLKNYQASLKKDFVNRIISIIKLSKVKMFRIHESGDFYSQEYANKWTEIIKALPKVKFYTYSKSPYLPDTSLKNLNIINSILPDGELNFGDKKHLKKMKNKYNFPVCPYTRKNKIICGKDCNICLTAKYVLFKKH